MKSYSLIALPLIAALVVWQGIALHGLRSQSAGETEPPPTAARPSKVERRHTDLPSLPADPDSADHQRDYLRQASALRQPIDRSAAAESWADSLTTPEALKSALDALDALTGASAEERAAFMRQFGPALFSQWGRIDPKGGLIEWAGLELDDQWLLTDTDPSLLTMGAATGSPFPEPLIASWSISDPDGLFKELTGSESVFGSTKVRVPSYDAENDATTYRYEMKANAPGLDIDLGEIFQQFAAQQDTTSLIDRLDTFAKADTDASPLPPGAMTSFVSNQLIAEQGGVDAALTAARALPESTARDRIVMDLTASQLMREVRALKGKGENAEAVDPSTRQEILTAFEKTSPAGQEQFLSTLGREASASWETSRNPSFAELHEQLHALHQQAAGNPSEASAPGDKVLLLGE